MTVKEQISRKSTKIARPSVGIDGINHAVRALYAYKESATYKDLAKASNLHPVYVSKSLSSARDVGLAALAGKRGLYKLTVEGVEYGRLLSYGKDAECRELLQKVILDNALWLEIIRFLRVSKGQEIDPLSLVADIEGRLGKRWSLSMRDTLAKSYTSILEYAKLITMKGGKMISELKSEEDEPANEIEDKKETKEKSPSQPKIPTDTTEFAEFRLPDSFILYVRKDIDAIGFFESQVKKESLLTPWLQFLKSKLTRTEKE